MGKDLILSVNFFKKFLKKIGIERVSYEAAKEFTAFLEEKVLELLLEAKKYMEHANRKTLFLKDIKLAKKRLNI